MRIETKRGITSGITGTVSLLVTVYEFHTGCNYISSEKLLSNATTSSSHFDLWGSRQGYVTRNYPDKKIKRKLHLRSLKEIINTCYCRQYWLSLLRDKGWNAQKYVLNQVFLEENLQII